jgi:hypothetical protein
MNRRARLLTRRRRSLLQPPERTLPDWFVLNRVHGWTRLPVGAGWRDKLEFKEAARGFKELGALVFTRHVKSSAEDPPWPTAVPVDEDGPLSNRNREIRGTTIAPEDDLAAEMIDEARTQGMRIVLYYWPMTEASVARLTTLLPGAEPGSDWVCRDPNGDEMQHPKRPGTHLDITSAQYREVVLTRLRELAASGADGLMFDERHLPPEGCWGSALAASWFEQEGEDAPVEGAPRYLEYLDFKARQIERTFEFWHNGVKAEHPEVVFAVSTTSIPALTTREMTTRLARIADTAKNEYRLALNASMNKGVFECRGPKTLPAPPEHVRQAIGWTVLRDSAEGRPPRIWAPGLPNECHAMAFAGSLLTFGCIAHVDVQEKAVLGKCDPDPGKTPLDGIRAAFKLGESVSPHFANTHVLRWAALHFSESIRNAYGLNHGTAWREVLWPLVGAYDVLCQDGLPVGTVNDEQLERGELDGYRLLFLIRTDELSDGQKQQVAAFRARGGAVVENDPAWPWSDRLLHHTAEAAFRVAVMPHLATASVLVRGGPKKRYGVAYHGPNKLVVAVTNDFSWVQVTRLPKPGDGEEPDEEDDGGEALPEVINPRAPDAEGVRIIWRSGRGLPETGPFHRLSAVEAVTGTRLRVGRLPGGFHVMLPKFPYMAMLVVWRLPRLGPFPPGSRGVSERAPVDR